MTLAWASELATGPKMVLLALCDNASDEGCCWPSIATVAKKCSMGERTVQGHIATLCEIGAVQRYDRPGKLSAFKLDPRKFCTPAESAPPQKTADTPAGFAGPIYTGTVKEPPKVFNARETLKSLGIEDGVIDDWLKHRKTKKAIVTQRVIDSFARSAEQAGMTLQKALETSVERGWTGFDPSWLRTQKTAPGASVSFREQDAARARARWEEMTGETHPDNAKSILNVVDIPNPDVRRLQ